jgi:hypothetical protein
MGEEIDSQRSRRVRTKKLIVAVAACVVLVAGCSAGPGAGKIARGAVGAALEYIVPLAVRSAASGCFGGVTGGIPDQPTNEVIVVSKARPAPQPVMAMSVRHPRIEPIVLHQRTLTCESRTFDRRTHLLRLVL